MAMFITDYLNIDSNLFENVDVFDTDLEKDSAFYINILRLKRSETPELKESYNRINTFFSNIATLLEMADSKDMKDKCYRRAYNMFLEKAGEVNGINLGGADSKIGSGMGEKLCKQCIADAYTIVKKGCKAPEIFHLLSLFEDGIGPDRLSDLIAGIILPDIQDYTKRIMCDFQIDINQYPNYDFDEEGYLINPIRNCRVYLVPMEILGEYPVAKSWEDVGEVAYKNEIIRQEMNLEVSNTWSKWASTSQKAYIKEHIFKNPEACERVIESYRAESLERYSVCNDIDYFVAKLLQKITSLGVSFVTEQKKEQIDSLTGAKEIIAIFKDWVENNRGWDEVQKAEKRNREKSVQRFIHLGAKQYIDVNNLDFTCEGNAGPGPEDFKVSRGKDKTIVEIKLSSNPEYMSGYENQVEGYAQAEHAENMLYVLVDIGNPIKVKKLKELHEKNINEKKRVPEVIIIDAMRQDSASNIR